MARLVPVPMTVRLSEEFMGKTGAGESAMPIGPETGGSRSTSVPDGQSAHKAATIQLGRVSEQFLDSLADAGLMADLGRLSARIIDELDTPLSVIVSAAQLILQEEGTPLQVTELVERIRSEVRRLAKLARDAGHFAGGESGATGEEVDLNGVLRDVLPLLKCEAQKRRITVIEAYDYGIPPIRADLLRLKQIFVIIIMNALQAMEHDGFLTIRTFCQPDGEVCASFSDSGPGIGRDILPFIFEPFFTTRSAEGGVGLGLFIARKLMEKCEGTIVVESIPGNGATFSLSFPSAASS